MRAPGVGVMVSSGPGGRGRSVPRWSQTAPGSPPDYSHVGGPTHDTQLFPFAHHINDRLAIWQGDISRLEVDVITNTTDETLLESNVVSDRIMSGAGPRYKEDILTGTYECRTGEVAVSPGFDLPCRHVVHTVSPNYSPKYPSAAETQLLNCYRNILSACVSLKARSIAVCSVTSAKPDFPPDLAAHVALRAIRRHMEQSALPEVAVLVSASAAEVTLWATLAPLYFPRSHREAHAARWRLPQCAGEWSAPERRIRIIHNPHILSPEDESAAYDEESAEAAVLFARAVSSDTQRLLGRTPAEPDYHRQMQTDQYERLLLRAQCEDLSEVSGIGCLYQSGVDRLGRPVVVFIGKWFPIGDIDLDKALLYLIKLLDPIVRGDYVIAYFHTLASSSNHPPFSWLKEVYTVLPYKYKKNLKAFYIIHPTFWTKMMTWWFTTFMAPAIKAKVHTLPGVEYLYSVMARDQLEVPAFVTEYDMTINGLHYFQPDLSTSET